jgi:diadenosine tetraphosphatase ApaH/serine/threonine PP2A family protein phosphatase
MGNCNKPSTTTKGVHSSSSKNEPVLSRNPMAEAKSDDREPNLELKTVDTPSIQVSSASTEESERFPVIMLRQQTKSMSFSVACKLIVLLKKYRRSAREKLRKKDIQWKLYNELEARDEAEMIDLATFLQTLSTFFESNNQAEEETAFLSELSAGSGSFDDADSRTSSQDGSEEGGSRTSQDRTSEIEDLPADDDYDNNNNSKKEPKETEGDGRIKVTRRATRKSINFLPIQVGPRVYDFCNVKFDRHTIKNIITIFENGGKITEDSIKYILRKVLKKLEKAPNITHITIDDSSIINVVGDLHGNLADLLHVFENCGLPREDNKYLFNGDFIDRGNHSFEVIILLFSCYIAYNKTGSENILFALNRGNHEDGFLNRSYYSFQKEILSKGYSVLIYKMFNHVFQFLPLFSVINKSVFIVHGGLFHKEDVTFDDLSRIVRHEFKLKPVVPYPENCNGFAENDPRRYNEYLQQLQREALWSDPWINDGVNYNARRKVGVYFGPDIVRSFMSRNNIKMIIRSHEPCENGFDFPYKSVTNPPKLCTLFSASNYDRLKNYGAYIQFSTHRNIGHSGTGNSGGGTSTFSKKVHADCNLYYCIHKYKTKPFQTEEEKKATEVLVGEEGHHHRADAIVENNNGDSGNTSNEDDDIKSIENANKLSLKYLILKNKNALKSAFQSKDSENSGYLDRYIWAEEMRKVTGIQILWLAILSTIVPSDCIDGMNIKYRDFLDSYTEEERKRFIERKNRSSLQYHELCSLTAPPSAPSSLAALASTSSSLKNLNPTHNVAVVLEDLSILDEIYQQRTKLERIFNFFDVNGDKVELFFSFPLHYYVICLWPFFFFFLVAYRRLPQKNFLVV